MPNISAVDVRKNVPRPSLMARSVWALAVAIQSLAWGALPLKVALMNFRPPSLNVGGN